MPNATSNQQEDSPLVSLSEIYTSPDRLNLFIINDNHNRLKHIETKEVKLIEDEICLLDILKGTAKCGIDDFVIDDIRHYFKIKQQIGFNPQEKYDFQFKNDKFKLHNLSLFINIQQSSNKRSEYKCF